MFLPFFPLFFSDKSAWGKRRKGCIKIISQHTGYLVIKKRSYCFCCGGCWLFCSCGIFFVWLFDIRDEKILNSAKDLREELEASMTCKSLLNDLSQQKPMH